MRSSPGKRSAGIGGAALFLALTLTLAQEGELAPKQPKHTNVYKSQFAKTIEIDMWSNPQFGKAPDGTRFLGPFHKKRTLYQTLPKLPPHRYVRLRFDLLALHSWDGERTKDGTDVWHVSVKGGPLLMCTLFGNKITIVDPRRIANGDQARMPKRQSFPDEYPLIPHKVTTGSSPRAAKLGFKFHRNDIDVQTSLYEFDMIFPHTGEDLTLLYSGRLSDNPNDENWGLNNIIVDAIDGDTPQSDEQLEKLWQQISGKDPVAAHVATWKVVAAGPKAAAFVGKSWQKLKGGDGKASAKIAKALRDRFEAITKDLTSEDFVTRVQAQKDLQALGGKCIPLVEKTMKGTQDPELRNALRSALAKLKKSVEIADADQHLDLVQSRVARIKRIVQTHANGYKLTSSVKAKEFPYDPIGAAADGYFPKKSSNRAVPRFTWSPNKGTEEWLQYEFPKAKTISQAEVFWFEPFGDQSVLPTSWKLLFQSDDGTWKEVEKASAYTLDPDKMNKVTFKAVTTKAVRLVAQLPEETTSGIHEFRLSNPAKK